MVDAADHVLGDDVELSGVLVAIGGMSSPTNCHATNITGDALVGTEIVDTVVRFNT